MELRKVQLTGGSSLAITLPKAWTERVKLAAGDVVQCTEQPDGGLAIQPHDRQGGQRAPYKLDATEATGEHLFREIVAAYLMGHDLIVVSAKRPLSAEARLQVRQAAARIVGLEVVEEEPATITLQDFLDPGEFHLDKALRRMGMLARAMQDEALQALRQPAPELVRSVEARDDEVDRLYWLVNKQFHGVLRDSSYGARMGLTASEALNVLLVARLVERTADHAGRIARQATELDRRAVPATLVQRIERQAQKAVELFRTALDTFAKRDMKRADALIDEAKKFQDGQTRLMREVTALGGEAVAQLAFILESIGRTAAYGADVAEVAINHKVAGST